MDLVLYEQVRAEAAAQLGDGWTFTPEDQEIMAATKRWTEAAAEVPTTSPARAYRSLLERRQCPEST